MDSLNTYLLLINLNTKIGQIELGHYWGYSENYKKGKLITFIHGKRLLKSTK